METPLLVRIADGDRAAVRICMDLYGGLVWSLALRMSPSRADAEDAVQEIFVNLMGSAKRYDPERASEATFIAMIARRRLIDRRRAAERRKEDLATDDRVPDRATSDHKRMDRSLEAQAAARAIQKLPEVRQRVLRLAMLEGLSHQQIADAVNLPLGTVKSHVKRGLEAVRATLLSDQDLLMVETRT
ncbi:MAG: sigma-70 family RNA polymerase sigma factor [Deltaproteobacteria bacterium]